MKCKVAVLFFVLGAIGLSLSAQAQKEAKPFSGEVVYSILFEGGTISESEKLFLPKEYVLSVSGTRQHGMTKMQKMGNQGEVSDSETGEVTTLLDIQGNKMAIKTSKEEVEKGLEPVPASQISIMEETKEIAGFKCQKAEVTMGEDVFTVYFTNEINVPNSNWKTPFKEIKGFLMEYTLPVPGTEMTMKYVATSVKKKKISASMFEVPKDYKVMTSEEAAAMFGQ